MKLNKRFFAVLAAAVLMLLCAVPVFAEAAVSESEIPEGTLLIAPAPSSSDVVSADDVVTAVESLGADAPADVATSFMVMGYGMLGIFIVMIIIMVVIFLLNALTKPRKK